eukprot:414915-Amphidinium_carterae.1
MQNFILCVSAVDVIVKAAAASPTATTEAGATPERVGTESARQRGQPQPCRSMMRTYRVH